MSVKHLFCVCFAWLVLTTALTATDTLSCQQLIQMIIDEQPFDRSKAQSLLVAAGTTPQLKCVASQSMAILLIRANKYSDAWKQATSDSASWASASRSVQLEHEKIKLWLLVEARSVNAEAQLKQLVTKVIHPDTQRSDGDDASYFLGKLLMMLQCGDANCGVSVATAQRAQQLLETQSSKTAVEMFRTGWKEAELWDRDLRRLLAQCTDRAGAEAVIAGLEERLRALQMENNEVRDDQRNEQEKEKRINRERHAIWTKVRELQAEMRRETPGKPRRPSEPKKTMPLKPFSDDSKEKWRIYEREASEYQHERDFHTTALKHYEQQLAEWKVIDRVRRNELNAVKAQLDPQLANAVAKLTAQQELLKSISFRLRDQGKQFQELRRQIDMTQRALFGSTDSSQLKDIQRPSLYPVLDLPRIAQRLSKMVNATP